jgi:hypothetical protein
MARFVVFLAILKRNDEYGKTIDSVAYVNQDPFGDHRN